MGLLRSLGLRTSAASKDAPIVAQTSKTVTHQLNPQATIDMIKCCKLPVAANLKISSATVEELKKPPMLFHQYLLKIFGKDSKDSSVNRTMYYGIENERLVWLDTNAVGPENPCPYPCGDGKGFNSDGRLHF